jgi:TrmH family RNA methyltransferase
MFTADDRGAAAPVLVLVAPQDIVNVASAVRIAKNFGISDLRVVAPEIELDRWRIEGIAHHTADLVARMTVADSLPAALADCAYAVILTGRERTAKRTMLRPREAARELVRHAGQGLVAIVAGREDKGLTNEELDHCQALVTISTDPAHPSLNLAQAVAIMAYESWLARGGDEIPFKPPRKEAPPATLAQLESVFADWTRALWAIDFFKTRQPDHVLRSFREIVFRAALDAREASLVRAMGIEVVRYLERAGVPVPPRQALDDARLNAAPPNEER